MTPSVGREPWSYRAILLFWWLLFVAIQQAERFFLLPEAWPLEEPGAGLLARTLFIGLRADLITATFGILLYSFRTETLGQAELSLEGPPVRRLVTDPEIAARCRRMLALYVSANTLLEQGRVWSWREPGNSL